MSSMWGELPSGREQAIETLIDMDPKGSLYRASRVLEVVPQDLLYRPNLVTKAALVDQAYSLSKYEVDTLEKYHVLFGTGRNSNATSFSGLLSKGLHGPLSETRKNRILKHHSKILDAKMARKHKITQRSSLAPSPHLVAALRHVYENSDGPSSSTSVDSSKLCSLLKSVMSHPAFSTQLKDSKAASSADNVLRDPESSTNWPAFHESVGSVETFIYELESLIAYLCENSVDDESSCFSSKSLNLEQGLLMAVLSLLKGEMTGEKNQPSLKETSVEGQKQVLSNILETYYEPTSMPSLQVGALLSLLPLEDSAAKDDEWALDSDLIAYFGEAAAVYEERIEIQTARLLKRLHPEKSSNGRFLTPCSGETDHALKVDEVVLAGTVNQVSTFEEISSPVTPAPTVSSPQPGETPTTPGTPDDTVREDIEASAAALSAAVFEQIFSAADGNESSSDDADVHHSSEDDEFDNKYSLASAESIDDKSVDQHLRDPYGADGSLDLHPNEDAEDPSSSSSSSASSSESDAEPEADDEGHYLNEEDEENVEDEEVDRINGDEEEDEMALRRALAMSLVEQTDQSPLDDPESGPERGFSAPVTPCSQAPMLDGDLNTIKEVEESPLPPLPAMPAVNSYIEVQPAVIDEDGNRRKSNSILSLDPSSLHLFGSVPAPNLLIYLLRYLGAVLDRRLVDASKTELTAFDKASHIATAVPGGMGSSLFPSIYPRMTSKAKHSTADTDAVSLQLLVALFLLSYDRRSSAIESLARAVALESKILLGEDMGGQEPVSGEEGDDPAVAMALTCLDEDSSESKESLETKGMSRKAAAAAHDAAVLLESIRKRTFEWRQEARLLSHCVVTSMRYLRHFLQNMVKRWIQEREALWSIDHTALIPGTVLAKLSKALSSLSSASMETFLSLVANEGDNDVLSKIESNFLCTRLQQESMLLWGETIPLLYPSVPSQVEMLEQLLKRCLSTNAAKNDWTTGEFPTEYMVSSSQLRILCRRMRVSDMLDRFVPSPACIISGSDNESVTRPLYQLRDAKFANFVIDLIGSKATSCDDANTELRSLYLSLCHRCHVRILLWDGFACGDSDADDSSLSLASPPGESMRVFLNPSDRFQFDSTKCSDSMMILNSQNGQTSVSNGSSVHQRASKVWGTVLSSMSFSPKSGVHRFAVRLDKCERGHVFIGVATAQASTRTYVGGDKYGWGMIGTQALWHDRRKIRGDYGSMFTTGSSIIVTLDTDAGTLCFSTWKEPSSNGSYIIDQVHSISASRRAGQVGGAVDDWGIAFEGLPLDSKLYPAVGLYQRDDRVTLLAVEALKGSGGAVNLSAGLTFYPEPTLSSANRSIEGPDLVRKFNENLQMDGIRYVSGVLQRITDSEQADNTGYLFSELLPSVAASICLIPPSIPVLSERFSLGLLPRLTSALSSIEGIDRKRNLNFQSPGPLGIEQGKWIIRATGSTGSSTDAEEYLVDFLHKINGTVVGFEGSGVGTSGKSKNGLVTIVGSVHGSMLHFVEEWTDSNDRGISTTSGGDEIRVSSCAITGRLSLDGRKFEGTYHNVQFGTSGRIAGCHLGVNTDSKSILFRFEELVGSSPDTCVSSHSNIATGGALLGLAHSHLSSILAEDPPYLSSTVYQELYLRNSPNTKQRSHCNDLRKCLQLGLFLRSSLSCEHVSLLSLARSIGNDLFGSASANGGSIESLPSFEMGIQSLYDVVQRVQQIQDVTKSSTSFSEEIAIWVKENDGRIVPDAGGKGSLSILCPAEYKNSRQRLICALLHHSGRSGALDCMDEMKNVWANALRILENGVRCSISANTGDHLKEKALQCCARYHEISNFLLCLETSVLAPMDLELVVSDLNHAISLISSDLKLQFLREELHRSSKRVLLRLVSMVTTHNMLMDKAAQNPVILESLAVAVPKLLGRSNLASKHFGDICFLGHDYLASVPGACICLCSMLQYTVRRLVETLVDHLRKLVSQKQETVNSEASTVFDSTTLALMACLTTVFRSEALKVAVVDSDMLKIVPDILNAHRAFLDVSSFQSKLEEDQTIISRIQDFSVAEVSRAILRAATAMFHAIAYQTWNVEFPDDDSPIGVTRCLQVLMGELGQLNRAVVDLVQKEQIRTEKERSEEQWLRFSGRFQGVSKDFETKTEDHKSEVDYSGLIYLLECGNHFSIQPRSPLKKSTSRHFLTRTPRTVGQERAPLPLGLFYHHYLSHWLHVLVACTKATRLQKMFAGNPEWVTLLLRMVGIDKYFKLCVSNSLPGRYRCRVLRLLHPVLQHMDPFEGLVRALFAVAGASSMLTQSLDNDEGRVSREAVSLLRRLHEPSADSWRDCINDTVHSCVFTGGKAISDEAMGVFCFLNGALDTLKKGSFVLLKPAAAVTLSAEQQALLSSNKSSSVGSGNVGSYVVPHHIIGNGTEGVVAGLCRSDASAGIVSNIDMKIGTCEVILLSRDRSSDLTNGSKKTLNIRALRTSLMDVVPAQEIPIFVDEQLTGRGLLSHMLSNSLDTLQELRFGPVLKANSHAGLKTLEDGMADVTMALMCLRASMTLLSDECIVSGFLKESSKERRSLAKALYLAFPSDESSEGSYDLVAGATKIFLSSLPAHEARLQHICSLFRQLCVEDTIFRKTPKQVQLTRIANLADSVAETVRSSPQEDNNQNKSRTPSSSLLSTTSVTSGGTQTATTGNRPTAQSTAASDNSDDEEESEAATTAAAHLREAAIAQMAELGLPRSWSELALRRVGGTNIEAAVHFCLERGGEMEHLLAEEGEGDRGSGSGDSGQRRNNSTDTNHLLRQLMEMGFPSRWCSEALAATGNNVDEALTWILSNGERLSAEDEDMEDDVDNGDDDEDGDEEDGEDSDTTEEPLTGSREKPNVKIKAVNSEEVHESKVDRRLQQWSGSTFPLRFISGRSIIDSSNMSISGLPSGGFSSVGTKGVLLTSGKWYYEAILETAGCLQIGWADGSFAGHCHAERGDGCGDGPSSWSFDGWRRYRWHSVATEWGCRWSEGDVVGCLVDMDEKQVSFTLNGKGEEIGMGVAFSGQGFRPCSGVYACVSFNRREKLKLNLGGPPNHEFRYPPPPGFRGVGEAVLDAAKERERLVEKESLLDIDLPSDDLTVKPFLCDFSDGEHGHELMAWAHRYYGADASVHLGSGRQKLSAYLSKTSPISVEATTCNCVMRRIEEEWSKCHLSIVGREQKPRMGFDENKESDSQRHDELVYAMSQGFQKAGMKILDQCYAESMTLASLISRKLLLHIIIASGSKFDPSCILGPEESELKNSVRFWKMIESCASLRSAGWVGEAGSMALAAEVLGLGITSNESPTSRVSGGITDRYGVVSITDLDDGILLPSGGIVQLLSTVFDWSSRAGNLCSTGCNLVASSEAAIGSDGGGGVLTFLLRGLQSAVSKSEKIRSVAIAYIRRSVRQIAVVEYDSDDTTTVGSTSDEDDIEQVISSKEKKAKEDAITTFQHDARFVSWLTGLLLSNPNSDSASKFEENQSDLFEAWSVGLLSASLPWRMVCAFTAGSILHQYPAALGSVVKSSPTLARYFGRLQSTVARRIWAERAAMPVCSRYSQAMVELLLSVHRAVGVTELPQPFLTLWEHISVDAATPIPVPGGPSWESEDGWISTDSSWEFWTGTVKRHAVDWKAPSRSAVRALMESGDGPPMLREGSTVMRGIDWDQSKYGNVDGKDMYDTEKERRDVDKKISQEQPVTEATEEETSGPVENPLKGADVDLTEDVAPDAAESKEGTTINASRKNMKKIPNPKLPVGTVLSVEPWNGVPGLGRRVRWKLTGEERLHRYGGDGGQYDLNHVEVNDKSTRVRKRYPLPESAEQCAARKGFGRAKRDTILLRLRRPHLETTTDDGIHCSYREGIMEWPEFGSGIYVSCVVKSNDTVVINEKHLLYGSKDAGWEARFGQASYVAGTEITLRPDRANEGNRDKAEPYLNDHSREDWVGSSSFEVKNLRRKDGGKLVVKSDFRIANFHQRSPCAVTGSRVLPPVCFDRDFHASSLSLSRNGRTLSCVSSEGRGTAFATVGFSKGVHYWEVKLEQADIGSVFVGVAEKPNGNGIDNLPRLNRWHGWGFVNFRATYTSGAERIYGAHCHAGDTIGVMLDCDAGRISFFFDGLKYGEHILNDLGCAFENLSPFGFNCDGCGSGGAGQGAPSAVEGSRTGRYLAQGSVRPRTLWPVVGLRNQGDRVTISSKWNSCYGVDGMSSVRNLKALSDIFDSYAKQKDSPVSRETPVFPEWFMKEAYAEYRCWSSLSKKRAVTRGSGPHRLASFGLDVDLDSSPLACASASALLGLDRAILAGDRVRLKRSAGRILELAEEAVVLGTFEGRLYYQIVLQKSEGGSLTEGGARAWYWDESEVVDGIEIISHPPKGFDIELPLMDRFKCPSSGGLKIVYEHGAVVRSDIEIFEGSFSLGTIPADIIIPKKNVLERRVNSCGVVRFRVRYESIEGWISSRIRGGIEEAIVSPVEELDRAKEGEPYPTSADCANEWIKKYSEKANKEIVRGCRGIDSFGSFKAHVVQGVIEGYSAVDSDSHLARTIGAICNFSFSGHPLDAPFHDVAAALAYGIASYNSESIGSSSLGSLRANQAAASSLQCLNPKTLPSLDSLLARAAILRALNRRARVGLPWICIRPCQEGSALFGGMYGHGACVDRAGRHSRTLLLNNWVEMQSLGRILRRFRGLLFTTVKKEFLWSVIEVTTTPTPLSHDEYELPREIRTVRINRLKARRVMAGEDLAAKRKYSVFSQLQNETKSWGGAALRRGFVAKGHGGQRRAFKVKLIGEGVNDYSGPYREIFTDALGEVLSSNEKGNGSLGVLDPTPNNVVGIGDKQELHMFSLNGSDVTTIHKTESRMSLTEKEIRTSFSSLTASRDEASRETEEALIFLGRVTGTAFRHGISLDLPLPMGTVWTPIVEEEIPEDRLKELDLLAYRQHEGGETESDLLLWQRRMLNSFMSGISSVLPSELFPIFTGTELQNLVCGNPEVDVDMLRSIVEYEGGYDESDKVIAYFWETLREFSHEDRKKFLQFVWARNRLPLNETEFDAPFKIQKDTSSNRDQALPSASTCFFSLSLPEYKNKEQLKEKLLFAINNVATMETDFQTNSAEISEGYRQS